MSSQSITTLLLLAPLLLASCAANNRKPTLPTGVSQAEFVKVSDYGEQVRQAITDQMLDIDSYSGKECTIMVSIMPNGMLMKATAEKGDPELCEAALRAVVQAKIPPAPDEKTGQQFKTAYLDFAM